MKRKVFFIAVLLGAVTLLPLLATAQTGTGSLPFLNIPIDAANAAKGGTYFGNEPTATSGQQFVATLPWLYDQASGDAVPITMFSFQNRNLSGGSLRSFEITHAGPYDHGGGNSYTFYGRTFSGGSAPNSFANHGDYRDWVVGAGVARPIDTRGYWTTGVNMNFISSTVIPTLVKDQGQFLKGYANFFSLNLSISYNGKDVGDMEYVTVGAAISNLGLQLSHDQNYRKSFLPTDAGLGMTLVKIFENGDQLSWPLDVHYALSPAIPTTDAEMARYNQISYGVFSPAGVFTVNSGLEYKYMFNHMSKNYLALRGGFILDGKHVDRQYSGYTYGAGVRISNVTISAAYFSTPQLQNTMYGKTSVFSLAYNL